MKIVTQMGAYHCGECGHNLYFPRLYKPLSEQSPYGIGWCRYWSCTRKDVHLKVPLTVLECEVVPTEETIDA